MGVNKNINDVYELRIVTFGQFKIFFKNGQEYHFSSRTNKLWNLFKLILVNGERGIPPELILENLYPDEEYQDSSHTVQNMIYRLRKLLINEKIFETSQNEIVYSHGYYKLKTQENIWLDFKVFDELTKKAEDIKEVDITAAIELYNKAISLYEGELFPELVFDDWIIPIRIYYNNLYLRSIIKLSELYTKENAYHQIIQLCEKALLKAPYEEEIHIQFMENLLKLGKVNQAKKHYEDTVKIFEKQYGILPTLEMQKIYRMLNSEHLNDMRRSNDKIKWSSDNEESGAFFCDYRDFYAIYILEKRRSERSGDAVCPVTIEFDNGRNVFSSNEKREQAVEAFKNILLKSLRRGDIITLTEDTQFIVLLPKVEFQQVQIVLERSINRFKQNKNYKDLYLDIKAFAELALNVK